MLRERVTKVQLVEEQLRREIEIGNFARGTALPPERELAGQFGVSYMTMRKAVGGLIGEGLLRRNRGSGTFVCNNISEEKVQKKLGFVIPAWSAPENLDFIMYISEACAAASWLVKIIYARSWEERAILDLWQNSDALVCVSVNDLRTLTDSLRERIRNRTKPIVFCDSDASAYGADSIFYLPDSSLEEAAELLYRLGHRRIVLLGSRPKVEDTLRAFLARYGVVFAADRVLAGYRDFEGGRAALRRILETMPDTTAVFCYNDTNAAGVLYEAQRIGLRIPEDLSVLGVNNLDISEQLYPRLTTIMVPHSGQGAAAAELLLARIAGEKEPDVLRGLEGESAKAYFSVFDRLFVQQRETFRLFARSKRPPLDRTNAVLSFLYTVCTNDIASALECVGLDPYIGVFHTLRPGRASLASDLMEEFRSSVERLVISAVNLKIIQEDDFEEQVGGAVLLNEEGRKKVITLWQNKKREVLSHPFLKEKVQFGLFPYVQANLLAKFVRGELSYYPALKVE